MKKFENRRDSGDNTNQANMSTGSEKGEDLIGMRFRYIDMFTKSGDSEYKLKGERYSGDSAIQDNKTQPEKKPAKQAVKRLEALLRQLKPVDSVDSTIQGKGDSKSEQPKSEKKAKFVSDYLNQNPKAVEFYHNLIVDGYIKINKGDIDLNRLNELSDRQKLGSAELSKLWELGKQWDRAKQRELNKLELAKLVEQQQLGKLQDHEQLQRLGELQRLEKLLQPENPVNLEILEAELTKVEAELTKLKPAELEEKQALEAAYIGSIRYNSQLVNFLDKQVQETETNLAKIADKFQQCLRDKGDRQKVLMEVCDGDPLGESDSDLKKLHKAIAISLNASGWLYVGVRNALAKGLQKADPKLDGVGAIEVATRLMPNRQYATYEAATKNLIDCLDKGFPRKYEDTQGQAFMTYKWELTKQPDQPLEGTQNIAEVYKKFHSRYQALKQEWNTLLNRLTPNDNGPELELRPTNEPSHGADSMEIPAVEEKGEPTKGREREKLSLLKTYQTAFLGASPDAVHGSADPTTSIVIEPDRHKRLEKIERDGNLWKVTYENRNDKHTFYAKEVVLGPEARGIKGNQVAESVNITEMFKTGIVDSETFIRAHYNLGEEEKAKLRTVIAKKGIRIIFSGEKGAHGANFVAQGEGYGVTLTGIDKKEEKELYRYMPYSLAKVAVIAILKERLKQLPDEESRATTNKQFRAAINQLDPTFRVAAAEKMSTEEAAKNKRARELLREHLPERSRGLVEEIEQGPIDLAYGLPPGGEVYNSSLKSAEISPEGGVTVTLQDGQVIKGRLLVLGKGNSAVGVLDKQVQEGLIPYLRDGNIVGVQTTDSSMKILDTTPDPRLPPHINEILSLARGVGRANL